MNKSIIAIEKQVILFFVIITLLGSCTQEQPKKESKQESPKEMEHNFLSDYNFLQKYGDVVLLQSENSMVAVSPALQGRVMTSSANGMQGASFGWINRAHYEQGIINKNINAYGGEERFWLGPEGGQYSIFFKEGVEFTFDNWFTPKTD